MGSLFKDPQRVVFIGAAGEMCKTAIELFANATNAPLVLTDINEDRAREVAEKLPRGRATARKLDLFDSAALRDAIEGAAIVCLGAGPYSRTSTPVLTACIEARVPYIDYDDDVESTQAALGLSERAKQAGVPCYIGCGASPGLSNIMVMDVVKNLDTVDTIDVCWFVGDERHFGVGKAVLEHFLHIAAGPCLTWADGKPTLHESWLETTYAPIIPSEKSEVLLHETAHPEPITLPRLFPNARRIRCLGACDPIPINGLARGIAVAVRTGALSMEHAVSVLYELMNQEPAAGGWGSAIGALTQHFRGGNITLNELLQLISHTALSVEPFRRGILGMIEAIWTGETTTMDTLRYVVDSACGKPAPYRSGILVRALGTRNGSPAVVMKRNPKTGPDAFLGKSMAAVTGASCAAFMLMALSPAGRKRGGGVFCPEDWAEPNVFYKALEQLGCPADHIVESL